MSLQIERRSADLVHAALVEQISDGKRKPGDMLSEISLAREFNTSRTPVREALHRLSAEGLAERGVRRAFIVQRMKANDLQQLFEAVGELEALVAGKAALRMTEIERLSLAAIVQEGERCLGDAILYSMVNVRFHAAISNGAHNSTLSATLADLNLRTLPWRGAQFRRSTERVETSHAEHRVILNAINAGDAEAASRAMRAHVAASQLLICEMLSYDGA